MPPALTALSYEEDGGKFYKLYKGGDNADHFTATQTCNSVGARLAMFKNTVRPRKNKNKFLRVFITTLLRTILSG